ncbi:MAG: transposase [Bacteroidota bacterium]|jgi:REP element-mobilizing transposase RayT
MPYRKESFDLNEFYYIFNRGNNKDPIFFEPENYAFFLRMFLKYFPLAIAEIHAFCLMPNHYHFLVRFIEEIDISTRMKYFGISYAKAINNRYERTGHLFEGRFKIKHVDSDEYLLHFSRYIHLNPFFAKLVYKAEDWKYSSYRKYLSVKDSRSFSSDTIGKLRESSMSDDFESYVNADVILSQFSSSLEYKDFIESFAEEKMKEIEESLWR